MANIDALLEVMSRLRDPQTGCPWDREQSFKTILPYTLEEVYEVVDAIETQDMPALREELGDLLFQVVFYAQMAKEAGEFDFAAVTDGIVDKLVRRHPHAFEDAEIASAEAQTQAWEQHKEKERAAKAVAENRAASVLDNIPMALPAITRAGKLQRRAARAGFDWDDMHQVLDKIDEEVGEIRQAMAEGADKAAMEHEIGDLIFACVNLARHNDIDADAAVRGVNQRFEWRFRRVEALAGAQNQVLADLSLKQMDDYWEQAKREEQQQQQKVQNGE